MKTIVKFKKILHWDNTCPLAFYEDEFDQAKSTGYVKRIKWDSHGIIAEIVDTDGTIYRRSSGKKRGRPKKEQPSVE
jgi:hypothetical protein